MNGAAVGLGSWRRSQPRPQPATGTASARKRSTSPPTVITAATCSGDLYSRGTSAKVNAYFIDMCKNGVCVCVCVCARVCVLFKGLGGGG